MKLGSQNPSVTEVALFLGFFGNPTVIEWSGSTHGVSGPLFS